MLPSLTTPAPFMVSVSLLMTCLPCTCLPLNSSRLSHLVRCLWWWTEQSANILLDSLVSSRSTILDVLENNKTYNIKIKIPRLFHTHSIAMLFSDSIKTISSLKFFAWNAHLLMTLNSVLLLLPFACCSPVFQKCFYCSEIRDGNLKSFRLLSPFPPPFATLSSSLAAERGMASTLNSLTSWTAAQLQVLPLVTYTEGKSGQNISTQDTFSIRPRSNDNFTDGLWSPPVSSLWRRRRWRRVLMSMWCEENPAEWNEKSRTISHFMCWRQKAERVDSVVEFSQAVFKLTTTWRRTTTTFLLPSSNRMCSLMVDMRTIWNETSGRHRHCVLFAIGIEKL